MDLALISANPAAYNSSAPSSMLPGDIAFSALNWFGILGANVVFTASVSNNMVFSSSIPPNASSDGTPPPYQQPGAWLLPAVSISSPSQAPAASLSGWRLAVTIVGSIVGAAVIVLVAFLAVYFRNGRRNFHSTVSINLNYGAHAMVGWVAAYN